VIDSPGGKAEVVELSLETGAMLEKAGVKFAVNTDDGITESRFLLRTAALTTQGGLSELSALKSVTIWPAEMLELGSRIGSIEPGKDADFVVLSGRPFSVYSHVLETYVDGVRRYSRETDGNYAIGGFDVADASRRPKPVLPVGAGASRAERPAVAHGDAGAPPMVERRFAIRADVVYPASAPAIRDGVVMIEDGKIAAVGPAGVVAIPAGVPVIAARAVTPGLIDAHTVVGVAGLFNVAADQDQDETSDPNQADLRILDSFNPEEPLLQFALEHGVTVVQACPGRVNVIAGQAGVFRTHGKTVEDMTIRFPSAMLFNLGESSKRVYAGKPPGTRMASAALVRNALVAARNDRAKRAATKTDAPAPDRNLKHEAMQLLLDRKIPAIFAAHRADDLETGIRIAKEFELKSMLALASEAYLMRETIKAAGMPVLVHPTMQRVASPETYRCTTRNASLLAELSIPIAITSAFEGYVPKTRVPLFEAAMAMRDGLDGNAAIGSVTIDAARILGIERDYGSLEAGKVADLVLYDGEPFEYATHVTHVIMNGNMVHDRARAARDLSRRGAGVGAGEPACCMFGY
jgi:imidazolonepropionase-like amidohydrolase